MLASTRILFWEKGYKGISIMDIAKVYVCRPSTFFCNFFSNKEALLCGIFLDVMGYIVFPFRYLKHNTTECPVEQLQLIKQHIRLTTGCRMTPQLLSDTASGNFLRGKRHKFVTLHSACGRILHRVLQRGIHYKDFAELYFKLAA